MSKVSVIIPAYNTGRVIAKTIQSVLLQSFPDFEILVVDDGSLDDTYEVASSIKDPRIKVFTKTHAGLSAARNFGMEQAQGAFIYFLDSDDWIEPNLLEDNLEVLKKEELDFVIWGYYRDYEDENNRLTYTFKAIPRNITVLKGGGRHALDGNHLDLLGYAWNKLYRHDFLKKYRLRFEEGTSLIEDILFNSHVISCSKKIRFIAHAYYHYIDRPATSLIKTFRPNAFDLIKRRRDILESWVIPWRLKKGTEMLSYSLISGIHYCIFNLFGIDNNLSPEEKEAYVSKMFHDPVTRRHINSFVPDTKELSIFKALVQNRMPEEACRRAIRKIERKKTQAASQATSVGKKPAAL